MPAIRGALNAVLLGVNTLLAFTLTVPPALVKLLVPVDRVRTGCDRVLNTLAAAWVAANNAWIALPCPAPWQIRGLEGLHRRGWYLVSSNHQSWVDILALQRTFRTHSLPQVLSQARTHLGAGHRAGMVGARLSIHETRPWYGSRGPRNHPAFVREVQAGSDDGHQFRRGHALHHGQACRAEQQLPPSARAPDGRPWHGAGTMGEQYEAMLDVTIVYPEGTPSFWALLCGNVGAVTVDVRQRAIPPHLLGGNPSGDKAYRERLRRWIENQWKDKDRLIQGLRPAGRSGREQKLRRTARGPR